MEKYSTLSRHPHPNPKCMVACHHFWATAQCVKLAVNSICENKWRVTFRQTNPCLCKHSHEGQLLIMMGDTAGQKRTRQALRLKYCSKIQEKKWVQVLWVTLILCYMSKALVKAGYVITAVRFLCLWSSHWFEKHDLIYFHVPNEIWQNLILNLMTARMFTHQHNPHEADSRFYCLFNHVNHMLSGASGLVQGFLPLFFVFG